MVPLGAGRPRASRVREESRDWRVDMVMKLDVDVDGGGSVGAIYGVFGLLECTFL